MNKLGLAVFACHLACTRPSDEYEVHIYGAATNLDTIEAAPEAMGGQIEYARYRFWGSNLGHGLTGLWGDEPRADGTSATIGYAFFGYPLDIGFDRNSTFLSPGPSTTSPGGASCIVRTQVTGYYGTTEYVDVGDQILLTHEANGQVRLERDPSVHHRPSGESWFSGYGGALNPVIQDHDLLPNNWISDSSWTISFPGTVLPPESTMGAIPYPTESAIRFPPDIENLMINGTEVRAPHHEYNDKGEWVDGLEDDVRFPGPWTGSVSITWTPWESTESEVANQPLTIVLRLLGQGNESDCDCNSGCSAGFSCIEGSCVGAEGAGWVPVAELACTVDDDGLFNLQPAMLKDIWQWVDPDDVAGAVLMVSRQRESTMVVPDALTYNGRRVSLSPVRTRILDIIATRLEGP